MLRSPQKHKLWVKWCKLNPKVVLIRFKNVFSSFFWDLLQKKKWTKIFFNRSNFGHFLKKLDKNTIFLWFFLTPYFSPKTDKLPKKSCRPSQLRKIITKKIYRTLWSKFTAKFKKIRPPVGPIGGVLCVFEILNFQTFLLSMFNKNVRIKFMRFEKI